MTIRVLVVDDQQLIRQGLVAILRARDDIDIVGDAADGTAAVRLAAEVRPDVVLMDLRMPQMDGVTATGLITALPNPPRVLVLTTYDSDDEVYDALRAGASGFLLKDVDRQALLEAVRSVARGDTALAPSVTRRVVEQILARPRPAMDLPVVLDVLSRRETEILKLVAEGLSNVEIADRLVVSETTVKTHVGNLLGKLGLRNRVQAVVLAYETGLVRPKSTA